jgi:dsRNA-specific ribonuclease
MSSLVMSNTNTNTNTDTQQEVNICDLYNPLNKQITLDEIQALLRRYGVYAKINNYELYRRAFIHRSYTKHPTSENEQENIVIPECPPNCIPLSTKSNERLEFIGDGVLELITKYYLYRRFPKATEGFMTEKKIALVKNEHIGKVAYQMRLHQWLIISKNAEEQKTRTNLKKLGCLFEAFLGALFLDFNKVEVHDTEGWFQHVFMTGPGFQMAQIFVEKVFEEHVDWTTLIKTDDNYKNILQVKIQKEFKITPEYLEISRDMETGFTMGVYLCLGQKIHNVHPSHAVDYSVYGSFKSIQDEVEKGNSLFVFLGSGTHKIKKKAEQIACEVAIQQIQSSGQDEL